MKPSYVSIAIPLLMLASCADSEKPSTQSATRASAGATASRDKGEKSVKPGINRRFKDPKLDVTRAVKQFEGESREVFAYRQRIARELGLEKGMSVADVGAGTGLFLPFFTKSVGKGGNVYAVEIAPRFIEFLKKRAREHGWDQVRTVFCTERSAELDDASVDVIFVCDTYHHFEYPKSTLRSLHSALRPGGRLVIVDFERIPGKSREWILGHVRCGKKKVIEEVTAAGFRFEDERKVRGLRENYLIRFRKPE